MPRNSCISTKQPDLMLNTCPKQFLDSLPLDLMLPGQENPNLFDKKWFFSNLRKLSSRMEKTFLYKHTFFLILGPYSQNFTFFAAVERAQ